MTPIKGAITSAGKCSIPLTLIVLGAYFYPAPQESEAAEEHPINGNGTVTASKSSDTLVHSVADFLHLNKPSQRRARVARPAQKTNPGETKTVVIAVLSRMVITPLLLMPLMAFSAKFDWHQVFAE